MDTETSKLEKAMRLIALGKDDPEFIKEAENNGMTPDQFLTYNRLILENANCCNNNKSTTQQTKRKPFLCFLSWCVLLVSYVAVYFVGCLLIALAMYLLTQIGRLTLLLRILCYLFGGSFLISLFIAPIIYGPGICIMASEAVHASKKGTRYLIFSIYMLLSGIFNFIADIAAKDINYSYILVILFGLSMLISSRAALRAAK